MSDEARTGLEPLPVDFYKIISYDFLLLDEAINAIAYGQLSPAAVGPRTLISLFSEDELVLDGNRDMGRYELAQEQLFGFAAQGKIKVFGKLDKEEVTAEPNEKPRFEELIKELSAEHFAKDDFQKEDHAYFLGGQWYKQLAVCVAEFEPILNMLRPQSVSEITTARDNADEPAELLSTGKQRGRPKHWDWERLLQEMVLLANTPDGLPDTQAKLERWAAKKCFELFGHEPATSSIRSKIAPIYDLLRQKGR
jgi:hypothetical protein